MRKKRLNIHVTGIVQGIGFRPFVYNLAIKNHLGGKVYNDTSGVHIQIEGENKSLAVFLECLEKKHPVLATIESITTREIPLEDDISFCIVQSKETKNRSIFSPPDISTCGDCLKELNDKANRRFQYPFINCTNCGPRFTIVRDLPYDRENTTMQVFPMCADCQAEYNDPANRRFHAQPNACSVCGPSLALLDQKGKELDVADIFLYLADIVSRGRIVALKGLGGFHLACDARNSEAVSRLRARKHRERKPFAIMFSSLSQIKEVCSLSPKEIELLESVRKPIVIIKKKEADYIAEEVSPNYNYHGVMLPYTPIHSMLLDACGFPLVMTSGNLSEDPIVSKTDEACSKLSGIADVFLIHNREIYNKCDDSVVMVCDDSQIPVRRARGYVPEPLLLPFKTPKPIFAAGAHLKNTFCFMLEHRAFPSQHIGDLENLSTLQAYEHTIDLFKRILMTDPQIIVADNHPEYLATKYAIGESRGKELIQVQHHHAHIASCMAENGVKMGEKVIGVAFDGTGWGLDQSIWGGEFLLAGYTDFTRAGYLEPVLMPGGEQAIREPWRMACAYLFASLGSDFLNSAIPFLGRYPRDTLEMITEILSKKINCILTTSAGRLFDGVSALLGIQDRNHYEGEAPIQLEMKGTDVDDNTHYPLQITEEEECVIPCVLPVINAILDDLAKNVSVRVVSKRFHETISFLIARTCSKIAEKSGLSTVALSGGVFQNRLLLKSVVPALKEENLTVLLHKKMPPNDACISLGQAVVAAARLQ